VRLHGGAVDADAAGGHRAQELRQEALRVRPAVPAAAHPRLRPPAQHGRVGVVEDRDLRRARRGAASGSRGMASWRARAARSRQGRGVWCRGARGRRGSVRAVWGGGLGCRTAKFAYVPGGSGRSGVMSSSAQADAGAGTALLLVSRRPGTASTHVRWRRMGPQPRKTGPRPGAPPRPHAA